MTASAGDVQIASAEDTAQIGCAATVKAAQATCATVEETSLATTGTGSCIALGKFGRCIDDWFRSLR